MPIEITGVEEIKETLVKLERAVNPDVKKMGDIARVLLKAVDNKFATQGGGTWKPNAPSTRPGQGGILEFTGKLRASMEPRVSVNSAEVKPNNSVYKYAAVNHYGSKGGRIPARRFMYLNETDIQGCMDVLEKPVDEAMK